MMKDNNKKDQYLENSRDRFDRTIEILRSDIRSIDDPVIRDIGGYKYLAESIEKRFGTLDIEDLNCNDLNTETLNTEDSSVDIILLCEVIEHIYNPDKVLEECNRILKPGGKIVITTPNLVSWYNRILLLLGFFPANQDISIRLRMTGKRDILNKHPMKGAIFNPLHDLHVRLYNLQTLQILLEEHGFSVEESRGYIVSDSYTHKVGIILNTINSIFRYIPKLSQGLIIKAVLNKTGVNSGHG